MQVIHRNLLMHIAHPHKSCGMESESDDLEYNMLPGDIDLPDQIPSRPGPVTWESNKSLTAGLGPTGNMGQGHLVCTKQVNNYAQKWSNEYAGYAVIITRLQ